MEPKMATREWMVLLYTTGLNFLLSSFVKPPSWIILKWKGAIHDLLCWEPFNIALVMP